MDRKDLTVGQDVIVRRASDRYHPMRPGKVVKIGRTLVTIQQDPDEKYSPEAMFYIDTQVERSDYSPGRFLTPEQAAAEERLVDDLATLREYGLVPEQYHRRPDPTIVRAIVDFLDKRAVK